MGKMKEEHIRFLNEASKPWEDFRTLKVMKLIEEGEAEFQQSQGRSVGAIEKRIELKLRLNKQVNEMLKKCSKE